MVCEQKHMGSRAVVIVCRDEDRPSALWCDWRGDWNLLHANGPALLQRSGAGTNVSCQDSRRDLGGEVVGRTRVKLGVPGLRAAALVSEGAGTAAAAIRPAGAAAEAALPQAIALLEAGASLHPELAPLLDEYKERLVLTRRYVDAYRRYCWPVKSLDDLRLAPFHLLASEGRVHIDKDHAWHMQTLSRMCRPMRSFFWHSVADS